MSRIGRLPIAIPQGVTITVSDDNVVTVKGPMGTLSEKFKKTSRSRSKAKSSV